MKRLAVITCLAVLLYAASAAASPPPGKYTCVDRWIVFATVKVRGNHYRTKGKSGELRSRGRRVVGKTGPLKGWRGKWYWTRTPWDDRLAEIWLHRRMRDVYCTRSQGR